MGKLVVIMLMLAMAGCGQVDPGERAVFVSWGQMDQKCYQPGFYFYNPISTNMDEIDAKTKALKAEKLSASTQNLQEVHADIVVNYNIDGARCHELIANIGHDY